MFWWFPACLWLASAALADTVIVYEYNPTYPGGAHDLPQRILVQDELGTTYTDTYFYYDTVGRTTREVRKAEDGADDRVTLTRYYGSSEVAYVVDKGPGNTGDTGIQSGDRVTWHDYDAVGRLTAVRITDGDPGQVHEEHRYVYDSGDHLTKARVLVEGTTYRDSLFAFDTAGRITRTTDSAGHYRVVSYDMAGRRREERTYNALETPLSRESFDYDSAGRMTRQARFSDASGLEPPNAAVDQVRDYSYDTTSGQRTTFWYSSFGAHTQIHEFDAVGRLTKERDPALGTTTHYYSAATGNLTRTLVEDGLTALDMQYGYDQRGRRTQITQVGSTPHVTNFAYDESDRIITVTDPGQMVTQFRYNALGERFRVIEDGGGLERVTDYLQDRLGRLTQVVAYDGPAPAAPNPAVENAQTTTYDYDIAGRQTLATYPDSVGGADSLTMAYDKTGAMTQSLDQRGVNTVYLYDVRGLLTARTAQDATMSVADSFAYDGAGRMTVAGRVEDGVAVSLVEFLYDDLGHVTRETQSILGGPAKLIDYEYDQAGNRTWIAYPDSMLELTYSYTALEKVDQVFRNGAPPAGGLLVDYDYLGPLVDVRTTRTNSSLGVTVDVGYDWDEHRRLGAIVNSTRIGAADPQLQAQFTYQYDESDNRTLSVGDGSSWLHQVTTAYQYDGLHRLTSATHTSSFWGSGSETFQYDLLGNRADNGVYGYTDSRPGGRSISYGPNDAANQYTTIDGKPLGYDGPGNLGVDETELQYGYYPDGRLRRLWRD